MTQIRKTRYADILKAAYEEFCESGYDRSRMENIARRAGIGKSTIYEYFPSKTELLVAVVEWIVEHAKADLDEIFTAEVSFREIVRGYLQYMYDMVVRAGSFMMALRGNDPVFQRVHAVAKNMTEFLIENFKTVISHAAERGEVSTQIAPGAAAVVVVSMSSPLVALGDWHTTMEEILDVLFTGMEPR